MIALPSGAEMRAIDKATIEGGVAALTLMERAGASIFHYITENLETVLDGSVLILCGPGNNGGDGLVLGRLLREADYEVEILVVKSDKASPEVIAELHALEGAALKYREFAEGDNLPNYYGYSLIVDALLGTGSSAEPRGAIKQLISAMISEQSKFDKFPAVLSIDIPSGINPDTGEVYEPCIKATHTAAIEHIKRGMAQYPALSQCGKIEILPIGLVGDQKVEFSLLDHDAALYPVRSEPRSHKGQFGRVLVIGGCRNMPGAPVLAGMAALRSGAGLVTVARPPTVEGAVPPELMLLHVPGSKGSFDQSSLDTLANTLTTVDSIVIGPGIGREEETENFLIELLALVTKGDIPAVIDADALNALRLESREARGEKDFPILSSSVLTPHPGEMGRLIGCNSKTVQRDRYSAARKLTNLSHGITVLKGARSIIYKGDRGAVCPTGNPYLATAGSGDILSGIIAALLAQDVLPFEAACKAVYLHGLCGDLLFSERKVPLIASDILSVLPSAIALCH